MSTYRPPLLHVEKTWVAKVISDIWYLGYHPCTWKAQRPKRPGGGNVKGRSNPTLPSNKGMKKDSLCYCLSPRVRCIYMYMCMYMYMYAQHLDWPYSNAFLINPDSILNMYFLPDLNWFLLEIICVIKPCLYQVKICFILWVISKYRVLVWWILELHYIPSFNSNKKLPTVCSWMTSSHPITEVKKFGQR